MVMSFRKFIAENVSDNQLRQIEKFADKIFASLNIDVEFTKHFKERVNDERNKKPITASDLIRLWKETYKKFGVTIQKMKKGSEAVIKDMATDVNVPFVLKWNEKSKELELTAKTIMRKKNFHSPDRELRI